MLFRSDRVDAARLIRPLPVVELPNPLIRNADVELTSHPHINSILVLSDINRLFEATPRDKKRAMNHVAPKLLFYAAHILSTPSPILQAVAQELVKGASTYKEEPQCPTGASGECLSPLLGGSIMFCK